MNKTDITIQGEVFSVPQPYGEGHTLTANEAAALNQVLAENLRNNFASRVAKAKEAADPKPNAEGVVAAAVPFNKDGLQTELDAYAAEYKFGERRAARAPVDPVEAEAFNLAKEAILARLKDKGKKLKDINAGEGRTPNDWLADNAKALVEKDEKYRKIAKQRIEARRKAVSDEGVLDGILGDAA